jgi:hypothetical protein
MILVNGLNTEKNKMAHYFEYPPEYVEDLSNIDWEEVAKLYPDITIIIDTVEEETCVILGK